MISRNSTMTFFSLLLLMLDSAIATENIHVQHAWIREAPPTVKVMAGYLEIENSSDRDLILVSAESDEFERIEFHLSQVKDGVARMQKQENIVISPNTTFVFKPESYHLMLFNNTEPMREGKSTAIKLTFKNGNTHVFDALVKKSDSNDTHHQHHH